MQKVTHSSNFIKTFFFLNHNYVIKFEQKKFHSVVCIGNKSKVMSLSWMVVFAAVLAWGHFEYDRVQFHMWPPHVLIMA